MQPAPLTTSEPSSWVGCADIEAALQAALQPSMLRVDDESHLHAGHAGARSGGHFRVTIAAPGFAGKARLAQHRLVYDALADLIPRGIHALAIVVQASHEEAAHPAPTR